MNNEPTTNEHLTPEISTAPAKPTLRARLVEKIRSELNIEKWPAIWQPAKSKNKPAVRVMEREMTSADGNRIVSRVEIGYTQLGTLTTEEQKMLYVLIKLWEEAGKPDRQVFFSSRALARMLKKKGWGTNVIDAITKSLRKLRTVPIEWINSYYDQTQQGAVVVDRRPLTMLGDLRVVERRQDGAVNSSQGYFKFDDHLLTNLQLNYTKPVCIEEFFKLRSEIAQLIYSHVDLILFDKNKYERRSRELFDDLGLKNREYLHMYERKRAIEKALKELVGIRLSSGVLRGAVIEKTADGKDYKVSFVKGPASARLEPAVEDSAPETAVAPVVVNHYSKTKDPLTAQAEELVFRFYRLFHDVEKHEPQSKETAQAVALITQYGFEQASHIVDFAKQAADVSHYVPQTFGGILQYTSRGLADFDGQKQPVGISLDGVRFPGQPSQPSPSYPRGEARLAGLTPEQYQVRFEQARAEVMRQSSGLASLLVKRSGTKLEEVRVRSFMIRQLEYEPMDLLVLGSDADPQVIRRELGLPNLPL